MADPLSALNLYPLPSFCFMVATPLDPQAAAFFRSVSGVRAEIEQVPIKQGGVNHTTKSLRGAVKWSNLVLKRGFTANPFFSLWLYDWILQKNTTRLPFVVTQLNSQRLPMRAWTFLNAFPVKWEISDLDATKSEVTIETLELSHEGMV